MHIPLVTEGILLPAAAPPPSRRQLADQPLQLPLGSLPPKPYPASRTRRGLTQLGARIAAGRILVAADAGMSTAPG